MSRRSVNSSAFGGARDVAALEEDVPRGRFFQPQDGAARGRFAAAGLAHEPQRFARHDGEIDAVDGAHIADLGGKNAAADGIIFFQPLDGEERRGGNFRSRLFSRHRIMTGDAAGFEGRSAGIFCPDTSAQSLRLSAPASSSGRRSGNRAAGSAARAPRLRWWEAPISAPAPFAAGSQQALGIGMRAALEDVVDRCPARPCGPHT